MAMALPGVRGHIQAADSDDSVQFMYNDERKLGGLVMVTVTPGGGYASVIKTFTLDQANPPQLRLLAPGAYTPLCHPGHACSAIHAEHQVISLCFGEAACRILYYENQQLREAVMTD
ncbi:hypothetical protein ASF61_01960 [Duganella sp. Leaf126]|nr:hypothetical protein ASF61_01960 [Duganella sp. Leaf126]